jgi:hypothetical protein
LNEDLTLSSEPILLSPDSTERELSRIAPTRIITIIPIRVMETVNSRRVKPFLLWMKDG